MLVEVDQGVQNLEEERLGLLLGQGQISARSHEFLQVELHVFEDQPQLFSGVDNFLKPNRNKYSGQSLSSRI